MNAKFITRTAILLALTLIFQFLKLPQLITGSIVNAMLLIAAGTVSIWSGITIGLLTPVIAFLTGIMGFPLMIPFIMAGNALYVMLFAIQKNKTIGMIAGATLKFIWLALSVKYIIQLFGIKVPLKIVQAFTLPQLITAIIGGILAIIIIALLENYFKKAKER